MNVIIDGNFLLHQTMHVVQHIKKMSSNEPLFTDDEDIINFKSKFIIDLNNILKYPEDTNKIILCFDSFSWRKEYVDTYKIGRKKTAEEKERWVKIYEIWTELTEELSLNSNKTGVFVSKLDKFEGDDLIHFWSDYFFRKGQNSLIVGNDNDLIQLVRINKEKRNYTMFLQYLINNRRLVVSQEFDDVIKSEENEDNFIDLNDLFKGKVPIQSDINNHIQWILNQNINLYTVSPKDILMNKIILGDSSDSIQACYEWPNSKKRYKRVTASFYKVIKDSELMTVENLCRNDEDLLIYLKEVFEERSKSEVNLDILKENINQNLKLIYLSRDTLPKELLKVVLAYFKKTLSSELWKKTNTYNKDKLYTLFNIEEQQSIKVYG